MATPLETLTESQLKLEREQLENAQTLSDTEKQRLQFITDRLSALDEERSKTKVGQGLFTFSMSLFNSSI